MYWQATGLRPRCNTYSTAFCSRVSPVSYTSLDDVYVRYEIYTDVSEISRGYALTIVLQDVPAIESSVEECYSIRQYDGVPSSGFGGTRRIIISAVFASRAVFTFGLKVRRGDLNPRHSAKRGVGEVIFRRDTYAYRGWMYCEGPLGRDSHCGAH